MLRPRILPLFTALLAGLLAALPATMARAADEEPPYSRGELIAACIQNAKAGLKTGQVMSNSQRMQAEEHCRAYAEEQLRRQAAGEKIALPGRQPARPR